MAHSGAKKRKTHVHFREQKERTFFQKRKKQEMEKYRAVLIFYAGRSQKKNIVTSVRSGPYRLSIIFVGRMIRIGCLWPAGVSALLGRVLPGARRNS